jgi:hypothetical protein
MFELLLSYGANVGAILESGNNLIHYFTYSLSILNILSQLGLFNKKNVNHKNKKGETPLVAYLLSIGAYESKCEFFLYS